MIHFVITDSLMFPPADFTYDFPNNNAFFNLFFADFPLQIAKFGDHGHIAATVGRLDGVLPSYLVIKVSDSMCSC